MVAPQDDELRGLGTARRAARGEILAREGEPGDSLFLIRSGEVEIVKGGAAIGRRGPGEWVGEMSLLDDAPRSATMRAGSEVEILELGHEDFTAILHRRPGLLRPLLRQIVSRLRESDERGLQARIARERLERELELARELQASLLPSQLPAPPGYALAAGYRPAREVGGDLYDVLELPSGRLGLLIADIWDKGLAAGIHMAVTRALLRSEMARGAALDELPGRLLDGLTAAVPGDFFITLCVAELDAASHRLAYVRAGHDYPLLLRDRRVEELRAPGLVIASLGLEAQCSVEEVELRPGDLLVLYSDGLTEAEPDGHPLGPDGLARWVAELRPEVPLERLPGRVLERMPEEGQADDMTLVLLEREG